MNKSKHVAELQRGVDPFGERTRYRFRWTACVLGRKFEFVANDARVLRFAKVAYSRLAQASTARAVLRVELRFAKSSRTGAKKKEPPSMRLYATRGVLCGMVDADNLVVVSAREGRALIAISTALLAHPYHLRYELLEFAVYLLAARTQGLLPFHAACFGHSGRGLLVVGASGAGKSTLALHCALTGFEFLAEDSVLIAPNRLIAYGVPNFLHLRVNAEHYLTRTPRWLAHAQVIRRRSGVRKFEIDARSIGARLARGPQKVVGIVFLSSDRPPAQHQSLLAPLRPREVSARLRMTQAYAVTQPGWSAFVKRTAALPGYVLYRGRHPSDQVHSIERLLATL